MTGTDTVAGFASLHGQNLFDYLPAPWVPAEVVDALVCLRDEVPEALQVVRHLEYWKPRDERRCGESKDFAYLVCRDGLYYERVEAWSCHGGWEHRPCHLVTWETLRGLLAGGPRRAQVSAWADTCTALDAWKNLTRPHELWPDPDGWHPSYVETDHARDGWQARLSAWTTVRSILTDAAVTL